MLIQFFLSAFLALLIAIFFFESQWKLKALCYFASILIFCSIFFSVLGNPRPFYNYLSLSKQGQIVAYNLNEPIAIYLWVKPQNGKIPVYYSLPWNNELAENLQKKFTEAFKRNGRVAVDFSVMKNGKSDKGAGHGTFGDFGITVQYPPAFPSKD